MSNTTQPSGSHSSSHRGIKIAGGALGLAALAYVGAAVALKDTVPGDTTVGGVRVADMSYAEAVDAVSKVPFPQKDVQAKITADGHTFSAPVADAWKVNAPESLQGLSGFTLNPATLWSRAVSGGEAKPAKWDVDQNRLAQILDNKAEQAVPGAAETGSVKFINGKVVYKPGEPGKKLDSTTLASQIATQFPKVTSFDAKVTKLTSTDDTELAKFAKGDAAKAMSAPLKFTANGETITVPTVNVSNAISTQVVNGKPSIKVDADALLTYVLSNATDMQKAPVDAKVVWKDNKPSVAPSKDGQQVDASKVPEIVAAALVGDHHAQVPMTTAKPSVQQSDIDVNSLPTQSISHFSSKLPGGEVNAARTKNIQTAINRLNGMVVLPGEQFSLLKALGYSFSKEDGYVEAGTIQGGRHVDGMGGGVSQVSTTVYNTAFFAGVQLDEHTNHTFYLPRYPVGREATLWNPGVDNKWTNNTGHAILIKAAVKDGAVVMDFYGTRRYSVETSNGPRTKVKYPETKIIKNDKNCETTPAGEPGFEIDVYRVLKLGGKVVTKETIHSTYQPDNAVICQ